MAALIQPEMRWRELQFFLLAVAISFYAVYSYWYIPNKVEAEKQDKLQRNASIAFFIATAAIGGLSYIGPFFEPGVITRKYASV
jgi:O-antigen/teichoic acid export membrane protein